MTDKEIRLLCGELTPAEMWVARLLCRYYERGIESVLDENAHLADGEVCTLSGLKKLAPHWKNNG
jgi:hypothetical protein